MCCNDQRRGASYQRKCRSQTACACATTSGRGPKSEKKNQALCQQNTHASKLMPLDWYVQRQLQDDDVRVGKTQSLRRFRQRACLLTNIAKHVKVGSGAWFFGLGLATHRAAGALALATSMYIDDAWEVRREVSRPNSPTYSAQYLRGSSVVWYCRGLLRKCLHCGAGCPSDCRGSTCGCGRQYRDDTTSFSKLMLECQRKSCGVCMSACKRAECSRNDTHAEICAVRGIVSPRRPHQCAHPHASIEICTCLSCKDHRSPGLLGFVPHQREPALTKRETKRQFQSVPHQFQLSPDQYHQDTCRYER